MSPPAWAYHLDNFDPAPDEELVCSVCRSVFCDPVQSPCNHVFCRCCLTKWLETSRTCPICRKRTTRSSIQDVVPLIRNMILKLSLHCRNSENGCTEKFSLEGCESHMKVCTYEMVRCKNRPCLMTFMRKDIREHELNRCPHRCVSCKTCDLKVSSRDSSNHNCIKALKRKLKTKDAALKAKTKEIKDLQEEIKNLKEADQDSSDQSSLGSVSATDIMIDLFPSLPSSDVGSSASDDNSNSYVSISEDDPVDWFDDFLDSSDASNPPPEIVSSDHNDDSIEYPRSSVPEAPRECPLASVDTSASTVDDEPLVRRPPKRRYAAQIVDTTDEENEADLERASLPSPKRSWMSRNSGKSQSNSSENDSAVTSGCWDHDDTAGPSHSAEEGLRLTFGGDNTSRSNASEDSASNSKFPFELRPRLKKQPGEEQTTTVAPIVVNGSPVFERTIAMLEQYNLESDPEWLPPASHRADLESSDSDISAAEYHPPPSGLYGSSITDSPSDSSDDDVAGTHNLFFSSSPIHRIQSSFWPERDLGLQSDSSEDDPDWHPH